MSRVVHILVLDPSFRNTGYVVLALQPTGEVIKEAGVIVTKKADKKKRAYAGDDNHRCAQEIATRLDGLLTTWGPSIIIAEAQAGSKSSKAAQLMGMSWGVISGLAVVFDIPVMQAQPTDVKEANCGNKKASKDDIREAVQEQYPEAEAAVAHIAPPSLHEHVYDALAVFVACRDSNEVRTLRQLAGGR